MAKYDEHFFEEIVYRHWSDIQYAPIDDDEKFDKLYNYVLKLEERIEQLEKKMDQLAGNDDDQSYYRKQQQNKNV